MNIALGVVLAVAAAFVWALASVLSKMSMRDIKPITLNVIRLLLSAAFYIPLVLYLGVPNLATDRWAVLIVSGVIGFTLADWFFLEGMQLMGVSRAAILVTFHPILTMFTAHYVLGRPLTTGLLGGAVAISIAVILTATESYPSGEVNWKGIAYVFLAQLMWTFAVIVTDWLVAGESVFSITGLRIGFGALGALAFVPSIRKDIKKLNKKGWGLIGAITILGTILGQYFFTMALKMAGSSVATPVTESSPIIASILAVVFLKERLTRRLVYAMILTTLGILMIGLFT
ncbi:DMT family transporter [Thermococcus sp.]